MKSIYWSKPVFNDRHKTKNLPFQCCKMQGAEFDMQSMQLSEQSVQLSDLSDIGGRWHMK